jgi:hypothetical protein
MFDPSFPVCHHKYVPYLGTWEVLEIRLTYQTLEHVVMAVAAPLRIQAAMRCEVRQETELAVVHR